MVTVSYDDIEEAFVFLCFGGIVEHYAYISLDTGEIHCFSEDYRDESVPDDIEESDRYLALPDKMELELGQRMVFNFVAEEMPDFYEEVHGIFHRKGAYSRWKGLLEREGMLEKWYKFEAEATEKALREWCKENEIEVTEKKEKPES